jgi:hypothetical protein
MLKIKFIKVLPRRIASKLSLAKLNNQAVGNACFLQAISTQTKDYAVKNDMSRYF